MTLKQLCPQCGHWFQPVRRDAQYCSGRCRNAHHAEERRRRRAGEDGIPIHIMRNDAAHDFEWYSTHCRAKEDRAYAALCMKEVGA